MIIRASTPHDAPALLGIWRSAVLATHHFLSSEDFHSIERLVADEYLLQAALWVALDGSQRALGFMGLTGSHVDALFVDAQSRGQGVGRALLAHAASIVDRPLSVDVNEQNPQAVDFYRHLGFVVTGRSPLDDAGRPYPLLHLQQSQTPAQQDAGRPRESGRNPDGSRTPGDPFPLTNP
jgi:putative acetyltransferase